MKLILDTSKSKKKTGVDIEIFKNDNWYFKLITKFKINNIILVKSKKEKNNRKKFKSKHLLYETRYLKSK